MIDNCADGLITIRYQAISGRLNLVMSSHAIAMAFLPFLQARLDARGIDRTHQFSNKL